MMNKTRYGDFVESSGNGGWAGGWQCGLMQGIGGHARVKGAGRAYQRSKLGGLLDPPKAQGTQFSAQNPKTREGVSPYPSSATLCTAPPGLSRLLHWRGGTYSVFGLPYTPQCHDK